MAGNCFMHLGKDGNAFASRTQVNCLAYLGKEIALTEPHGMGKAVSFPRDSFYCGNGCG
jgi:hypothetical protein